MKLTLDLKLPVPVVIPALCAVVSLAHTACVSGGAHPRKDDGPMVAPRWSEPDFQQPRRGENQRAADRRSIENDFFREMDESMKP